VNFWETIFAFVCGASCAVVIGMIVVYLWLYKSFRNF
jgi:hypothetical protein